MKCKKTPKPLSLRFRQIIILFFLVPLMTISRPREYVQHFKNGFAPSMPYTTTVVHSPSHSEWVISGSVQQASFSHPDADHFSSSAPFSASSYAWLPNPARPF